MSVATSTCSELSLNEASARVRAFWLLLPWMASDSMPSLQSCSASRFAPCLVRVNTSTWNQLPSLMRCDSRWRLMPFSTM